MAKNWQQARKSCAIELNGMRFPTADSHVTRRPFDPATDLAEWREAADRMEVEATTGFQRDQALALRDFIAELGG
jgi:hypothetical protein